MQELILQGPGAPYSLMLPGETGKPSYYLPAIVSRKTGRLQGSVHVAGSKNVGLKLLAMAPLFQKPVSLKNVPRNNQVRFLMGILESMGVTVFVSAETDNGMDLTIHAPTVTRQEISDQEMRWCRHVFLLALAILFRTGSVSVPLPGYSHYGYRPIDKQLDCLRSAGVVVHPVQKGAVKMELPEKGFSGGEIILPFPSNAVTEALILAAATTEEMTVIHGAAQEPETTAIVKFLMEAGVVVLGSGTSSLTIRGHGAGLLEAVRGFVVTPDRVEAATLGATLAICGGEVCLKDICPRDMLSIKSTLSAMGVSVKEEGTSWTLRREGALGTTDITTAPFPGFPTDVQGPFLSALCAASGTAVIRENMWSNRLSLAMELKRLGADINLLNSQTAMVRGVSRLSGSPVIGTDPRAVAALMLAGLFADGETMVTGIDLLDNAYDRLDKKLIALGANIERVVVPQSTFSNYHPIFGRLEAF